MPPSCDSGTALNPWPRFQWVFHRSVEGKKPQEAKHTTAGSRSGRRKKSQGSMNYRITASRSITLLLNLLTKEDPVWSRVSVSVKRWCTPFRAHKISTRYGCLFHMIASFRYRKYAKPSSTSVKKKWLWTKTKVHQRYHLACHAWTTAERAGWWSPGWLKTWRRSPTSSCQSNLDSKCLGSQKVYWCHYSGKFPLHPISADGNLVITEGTVSQPQPFYYRAML